MPRKSTDEQKNNKHNNNKETSNETKTKIGNIENIMAMFGSDREKVNEKQRRVDGSKTEPFVNKDAME